MSVSFQSSMAISTISIWKRQNIRSYYETPTKAQVKYQSANLESMLLQYFHLQPRAFFIYQIMDSYELCKTWVWKMWPGFQNRILWRASFALSLRAFRRASGCDGGYSLLRGSFESLDQPDSSNLQCMLFKTSSSPLPNPIPTVRSLGQMTFGDRPILKHVTHMVFARKQRIQCSQKTYK